MIFKRKKPTPTAASGGVLRGRQRPETNPLQRRMQGNEEPETVDLEPQGQTSGSTESVTRVLGASQQAEAPSLQNPVAGWLVVISGPGVGQVLSIGYGVNPLGRDVTQKLFLDHGDERISRREHALLTYDSAARNFYLQHGGGTSLTYLNNEALLTPTKLSAGDQVRVGDTLLRFVPLCSEEFDWEDIQPETR
jgi:hypothetical protein